MKTIYGVLFIALLAATVFATPEEKKPEEKKPEDKKPEDKTDAKTPKVEGPPPPAHCSANGVLLASATSCTDESPDECKKLFPTAATANPAKRDPNCDNELMKSVAIKKCAKTCALCCKKPKVQLPEQKRIREHLRSNQRFVQNLSPKGG